jgi:uncharacterized protein (TIGR01777 family)
MAASVHTVERTSSLPVSADDAFTWHLRPGAFERLLPPWERVEVVERSGPMEDGAWVVLRLQRGPISFRWVARHRDFVPGRQFVDDQVQGPFASWVHLHRFEPDGTDTSWMTDRVEFTPPLGPLGTAGAGLIARPIERMLAYRHTLLAHDLAAHDRFRDRPRLRVAVTGATGLLGSGLGPFLTTGGHTVLRLTRSPRSEEDVGWDPTGGRLDGAALTGIDAAVHLAGENIGARWTAERKRRMRESRLRGTRLLAETLARLPRPPRVLVSASAVGIYGDRGDTILTEGSPVPDPPTDFLVELGREWEAATEPARRAGIRVVLLRFGIVLTPAGGALGRMLPAFRLGVGGPLGSGRQWTSWVAIDDAVGAVHHALMTDDLEGPVNVTAPEPVTGRVLADTLARVLHRPALAAAPAPALKLVFGEMAGTALLAGQRVLPARLSGSGYRFRLPALEPALRHLLGR